MGIFEILPRLFHSQSKVYRVLRRVDYTKKRPTQTYVYVLGCGYKFNSKAVFLYAAGTRVLFNCGPGISRLLSEHKGKFRKLSAVLATKPTWENIGGLPSVLFKLNDSKSKDCTIFGFPEMENMLKAGQRFLHYHHCKLVAEDGDFTDNNVHISQIKLIPQHNIDILNSNIPKNKALYEDSKNVNAYILKTNLSNSKGVVNVEKILEMGVTPGMQLVNLLNGNSVTLPNGKVIHPEAVVSPYKRDVVVAIECPSEDYFSSIEKNETFLQSHIDSNDCCTTVIHFSPPSVMKRPRYIKWMKKFSPSTFHLIVNESNVTDGLVTLRYRQYLLSKLHPGIFPPLNDKGFYWIQAKHHCSKHKVEASHIQVQPFIDCENPDCVQETVPEIEELSKGSPYWLSQWKGMEDLNIIEARPGTRIPFRPLCLERVAETIFDEFVYHEGFKSSLPQDILARIRTKFFDIGVDLSNPSKIQADYENSYPRIVFLGTSSKSDTRDRNVTGILLRISKDSSILLDCGEAIHSQIHRLYGEEATEIFRTIKAIYISHLHGDHHMGLTDIIRERANALKNETAGPLILFAPRVIKPWLNFTERYLPDEQQFKLISLCGLLHDGVSVNRSIAMKSMDYVYSMTGIIKIQTVRVPHCNESYGVAIQHADGWKITYSGDSMFSDRLNVIGEGSDLLIHEATYDDTHEQLALKHRHSTVSQAVETGRRMKAKFTILTHISQRYSIVPSDEMTKCKDFSFAFDFMQVPLRYCHHLPILHELYSYLNDAFLNEKSMEDFYEERESVGFVEEN